MLQFKKSITFMFMFTIPQFLRLEFVIAIIIPDRYLSVYIPESIPFRVPQQQGLESASTAKPGWLTKIQARSKRKFPSCISLKRFCHHSHVMDR
jgi:hypothetical protein